MKNSQAILDQIDRTRCRRYSRFSKEAFDLCNYTEFSSFKGRAYSVCMSKNNSPESVNKYARGDGTVIKV